MKYSLSDIHYWISKVTLFTGESDWADAFSIAPLHIMHYKSTEPWISSIFWSFKHPACLNSLRPPRGSDYLDSNEVDIWPDDSHAAQLEGHDGGLPPSIIHQVWVKGCPASRRTAVGSWRRGCKTGRNSLEFSLGPRSGTDAACHHLPHSSDAKGLKLGLEECHVTMLQSVYGNINELIMRFTLRLGVELCRKRRKLNFWLERARLFRSRKYSSQIPHARFEIWVDVIPNFALFCAATDQTSQAFFFLQ